MVLCCRRDVCRTWQWRKEFGKLRDTWRESLPNRGFLIVFRPTEGERIGRGVGQREVEGKAGDDKRMH